MAMPTPRFENIDNEEVYHRYLRDLGTLNTKSFVVEFDDHEARCALNPTKDELLSLLEPGTLERRKCRWINFFGGDLSKDSIKLLASHYNLSPRFVGLLCLESSPDSYSSPDTQTEPAKHTPIVGIFACKDIEMGLCVDESHDHDSHDPSSVTWSDMVDNIIHFHAIDVGRGYLCVGRNSFYLFPGKGIDTKSDRPSGKRLFTALALCDNGTVISVTERPHIDPSICIHQMTKIVRRHTLNVFRHLSARTMADSGSSERENELAKMTIRKNPSLASANLGQDAMASSTTTPLEHASLLFYYLFDDWATHYQLVTRRGNSYSRVLDQLRERMFQKADVELIKILHSVGRQVSTLKRMYQSIQLIIKRILELQETLDSQNAQAHQGDGQQTTAVTPKQSGETVTKNSSVGVRLSAPAAARFQALTDRISLFGISQVDEYLEEKEALVYMNFNLISLKESQAVERLTRNTVAISKIAAFFLPLSLMTAYFSTSIPELEKSYSAKTYWFAFLVVIVLTGIALFSFELMANHVQGRTDFRSLTRIFMDSSMPKKGSRSKAEEFG